MKNERHNACLLLDRIENVETKSRPSFGIFAVDVADSCCEHIYAEICNSLALIGICALAHSDNAVFLAADRANLSLDRKTELVSYVNELGCLGNVLLDVVVRAVEHDGCEAGLDALVTSFVCAVVEVKSNRNSDPKALIHSLNHSCNCAKTCHVLACALGYTKDNRALELLSCEKN